MPPRPQRISDHCDGKRFFSPGAPPSATWRRALRWWISRPHRANWPKWVELPRPRPLPPIDNVNPLALTWINHSTFLLRSTAGNFLFDPVYSRRTGPFGLFGPKRVHAPAIPFDSLPQIDFLLLSHDHYDHCDIAALTRLAKRDAPLAITPLANAPLLIRAGFKRIIELDWWESASLPLPPAAAALSPASVTVTPAQHWSSRAIGPRCQRLWGGFNLSISGHTLYFAGDTGYHPTLFREIATRLGSPDTAILPIGAYLPRWFMRPQHCDPTEAVQIHRDLRAGLSIAMHWGCFRLTDEERDAPPLALAAALAAANLPPNVFRAINPGETVLLHNASPLSNQPRPPHTTTPDAHESPST
ncbi:MAG: MBL fold metallo-hydrolase [Puniceicoccales bacterium]|nr:MBL fold metallo-hydrolase [Puniceicoccales bacterium]